MIMSRIIVGIPICVLLSLGTHAAEPGKAPADWWNHSALAQEDLPDQWLSHFELTYSHQESQGNSEGYSFKSGAKMVLRKKAFSSLSSFSIAKSKVTTSTGGESTTERHQEQLSETLVVDLTKRLSWLTGAVRSEDRMKYIDQRFTYYTGCKYDVATDTRFTISLGAFVGYDDTSYLNDELAKLVPGVSVPDYESGAAHVAADLRWKITDTLTFTEKALYVTYFDDSEFYRWELDLGLDLAVSKHISMLLEYDIRYDDNVFEEVASEFGYEKQDSMFSVGLKVSL